MKRHMLFGAVAALGAIGAGAGSATAETYTWIGSSGESWDGSTNWSPNGVPGPGDTALIGQDDPYQTFVVNVDASTTVANLTLDGGSDLILGPGATLDVTGTTTLSAAAQPGGGINFAGVGGSGTLIVNDGFYAGTGFSGTAALVVNGTFATLGTNGGCDGGTGNAFTINGTVVNTGNLWAFGGAVGSLLVNVGGEIQVASDSVTSATDDESFAGFVNHGTIRSLDGGSPTGGVRYIRESDGAIVVGAGHVLRLEDHSPASPDPSLISGSIFVDAGGTLIMGGGLHTIAGPVTGTGTLQVSSPEGVTLDDVDVELPLVELAANGWLVPSGTSTVNDLTTSTSWHIDGAGTIVVDGDFAPGGNGNVSNGAVLDLAGTATVSGSIAVGGTLRVSGDVVVTGSINVSGASGALEVMPAGVLTLDAGASASVTHAGSFNDGTIVKTGAAPTTIALGGGWLANDGLIDIQEGTLQLNQGVGTHTGDVQIAADARLELVMHNGGSVTWDASSTIVGDGELVFVGPYTSGLVIPFMDGMIDVGFIDVDTQIRGSGTIHCDDMIHGETIFGALDIVVESSYQYANTGLAGDANMLVRGTVTVGPQTVDIVQNARLEIEGHLDCTGKVNGADTSRLVILPGATADFTSAQPMGIPFDNQGTMSLLAASHSFTRSSLSTNDGLIEVIGGPVDFATGMPAQGLGGALRLAGTTAQSSGQTQLAFAGGLVAGTGSVNENVALASTTISPGASPGELAISGNLTMDADSAMVLELGGSVPGVDHDLLAVSGNASVNGLLLVGYVNDYEPTPGDMFTFLNANAVSGAFTEIAGVGEYDVVYGPDSITLVVLDTDVTCRSDLGGDDATGFDDLLVVLAAWGPCGDPCPQDLDGNGTVDFGDILLTLGSWGPCPENVAYDVTFSSPLHTVGLPPAVGAGPPVRETVSGYVSNTRYRAPMVVATAGGLADQPLLLDWSSPNLSSSTRLEMWDLPSSPRYRVEMDVSVIDIGFGSSFGMQFNTAAGVTMYVVTTDAGLTLRVGVYGNETTAVVPFTEGQPMALRFEMDFEAGVGEIFVDDALQVSGAVPTGVSLQRIWLNGSRSSYYSQSTGQAAIDNIRITAIQ